MVKVEYVPLSEMLPKRELRHQSQRRKIQAEYEAYIQQLGPDQAGKLVIEPHERISTVRDRLRRAAQRLDKPVQIRRKGDVIFFRLLEKG
jgi:hypothetical protein